MPGNIKDYKYDSTPRFFLNGAVYEVQRVVARITFLTRLSREVGRQALCSVSWQERR